ncbi:hypothetical protein BBD41_01095 [Paenibacillus ihbetae]|uniref:Uncharacterized protein n=1 Tax=Paenibacillus ihbetae TaxID=1870820 RepID=A0A1B2DUA4_9BACL|nr:hypothetical protein BBD41_01095 [Paenibacillus ihbetae]
MLAKRIIKQLESDMSCFFLWMQEFLNQTQETAQTLTSDYALNSQLKKSRDNSRLSEWVLHMGS